MPVFHNASAAERRRILTELRKRTPTGKTRKKSVWAPWALMAWAAGVPEQTISKAVGYPLIEVREAIAESLVADERYETALSESRHS